MSLLPVLCEAEAERWIAGRSRTEIDEGARAAVRPIVEQVRARGDAAVREYSLRFDGVALTSLQVRAEDRRDALRTLSPERRGALEEARANLEAFHRSQRREEARVEVRRGVTVWREFRPIGRVGVYMPGGRADYPSSVLMAGVPARLAGCPEIVALADETANPRWVAADLISQAEHAGDALAVCVTVDAGSNHVLPTARAARAFDGLSVDDFGEWVEVRLREDA